MKKIITLLVVLILMLLPIYSVMAEDGTVTYNGESKEFIFEPGSEKSPTDLFANFKSVMPGDSLTQKITVKNDASKDVKVKIYMRSIGAKQESIDFLSQLKMRVQKDEDNEMAYMFDATADVTDGLTDWVCLGTLFSGGTVDLNVILDVPVELDNNYSEKVGLIDWEFKVEEFEIEKNDPVPPTGDNSKVGIWIAVVLITVAVMVVMVILGKKKKN